MSCPTRMLPKPQFSFWLLADPETSSQWQEAYDLQDFAVLFLCSGYQGSGRINVKGESLSLLGDVQQFFFHRSLSHVPYWPIASARRSVQGFGFQC